MFNVVEQMVVQVVQAGCAPAICNPGMRYFFQIKFVDVTIIQSVLSNTGLVLEIVEIAVRLADEVAYKTGWATFQERLHQLLEPSCLSRTPYSAGEDHKGTIQHRVVKRSSWKALWTLYLLPLRLWEKMESKGRYSMKCHFGQAFRAWEKLRWPLRRQGSLPKSRFTEIVVKHHLNGQHILLFSSGVLQFYFVWEVPNVVDDVAGHTAIMGKGLEILVKSPIMKGSDSIGVFISFLVFQTVWNTNETWKGVTICLSAFSMKEPAGAAHINAHTRRGTSNRHSQEGKLTC